MNVFPYKVTTDNYTKAHPSYSGDVYIIIYDSTCYDYYSHCRMAYVLRFYTAMREVCNNLFFYNILFSM
jgi:hypothetical protein